MSCTKDTPRCPEGPSYLHRLPECCRSHDTAMMAAWGAALTTAGVTWWIDYGSVLGAVRNPLLGLKPGIIPHDKDCDIGILGADQQKVREMASGPWAKVPGTQNEASPIDLGGDAGVCQLVWKPPKGTDAFGRGDSFKLRWSAKNKNNIDAFSWYLDERKQQYYRKRYISVDHFKGREVPAGKLFPLQTLEWEGLQVPAPADAEWFCAHRYGPTWKTPIRRNHAATRVR